MVDTTHPAEIDFAIHSVSEAEQERIAKNLKSTLRSESDRTEGYIRVREIVEGWEVAFTHYADEKNYVVLIIGYGRRGEMESGLKLMARASLEQYAPGVRVLLQGRRTA